jgi:hypothetical protein
MTSFRRPWSVAKPTVYKGDLVEFGSIEIAGYNGRTADQNLAPLARGRLCAVFPHNHDRVGIRDAASAYLGWAGRRKIGRDLRSFSCAIVFQNGHAEGRLKPNLDLQMKRCASGYSEPKVMSQRLVFVQLRFFKDGAIRCRARRQPRRLQGGKPFSEIESSWAFRKGDAAPRARQG